MSCSIFTKKNPRNAESFSSLFHFGEELTGIDDIANGIRDGTVRNVESHRSDEGSGNE